MPTAAEFEHAAKELSASGDSLRELVSNLSAALTSIPLEGPALNTLTSRLDAVRQVERQAASEIQEQMAEARRRAAVCRAFTAEVDECRSAGAPEPQRPSFWVTYG